MSVRCLVTTLFASAGLAMAELPYAPDVFNEIEIVAPGALMRPTYNAFSAWVSALPLSGNRTNFRIGMANPIGQIFVERVTGFDANCVVPSGVRLDICATSIDRPSYQVINLKVYTQVKKVDGSIVVTPLSNEVIAQNIMIRALGRVFGMSWDYQSSESVMWAMPLNGDWGLTGAVMFPSVNDANVIRTKYFSTRGFNPFPDGVTLAPIALMEQKTSNGVVTFGAYTRGVIGHTLGGSLRQLRWIVSSSIPDPTGNVRDQGVINVVYPNSRVGQENGSPSCYPLAGTSLFRILGKLDNSVDYLEAINSGAVMTDMIIESASKYDIFTSSHPGGYSCYRSAGAALDTWGATYW